MFVVMATAGLQKNHRKNSAKSQQLIGKITAFNMHSFLLPPKSPFGCTANANK